MMYRYEDLSDDQFEELIVLLCRHLLGVGVKGFAKGPDGGRDAKFVGTAELHPSKAAPWTGTIIVQAKHTNGYNKHFSETDFYNPRSEKTVIGEEVPRIKNLRDAKQLDHYMLFSNRRLAGNADQLITAHIAKETGLTEGSIYLCGVEQLESWLKQFPAAAKLAKLDPVDSPLIVSPDELAVVVQAFAAHETLISETIDTPPTERTPYEEKNALNQMTPDYAKALRKLYLKDTAQIHTFLAAPENLKILRAYEAAVEEFQLKIIAKRKNYQNFDAIINYLVDLLFARDPVLRQHKRLTRAMVFYMYWNCDIGLGAENVATK
ncbi:MAG: hypothetical protein H7Z12_06410 [Rhodospirillaceae bacterium]|nr:hypothetical protein [Rhodospirillales bacterium]